MTKFKKARVDIYHEKFYRYLMEGHKREEEVDLLDVCVLVHTAHSGGGRKSKKKCHLGCLNRIFTFLVYLLNSNFLKIITKNIILQFFPPHI